MEKVTLNSPYGLYTNPDTREKLLNGAEGNLLYEVKGEGYLVDFGSRKEVIPKHWLTPKTPTVTNTNYE